MANWCVGTLKVRGKTEDLKRFVLEGLSPCSVKEDEELLKLDEFGDIYYNGTCWIDGTTRGFVEGLRANFSDSYDEDMIFLDARFAWKIKAAELLKVCKEYNVDMRIFAYEQGVQFNQHIEIVGGEITRDEQIRYGDYYWECPNPTLGG